MATLSKNDSKILELKKKVEEKKALLQKSERFTPNTNCSLMLNGVLYNIHTLDKDQVLLLIGLLKSINSGVKEELDINDFTVSNYLISEWVADLKSKYNNLNLALEKDKLKTLQNALDKLLSNEMKVSLELESIEGLLE